MNKSTRAAEVWAKLERRLIETCGLPSGRMLEINRPYLIRLIGDRLKAVPVDTGRAAAVRDVRPPLPVKCLRAPPVENPVVADARKGATVVTRRHGEPWLPSDTIHDPVLAAMLERSCSRRVGYDGDDSVEY